MSDSINGFTVVLEKDVREERAEAIQNAICMIKGVISVTPQVSTHETYMAEERARLDLGTKLIEIIYPKSPKSK